MKVMEMSTKTDTPQAAKKRLFLLEKSAKDFSLGKKTAYWLWNIFCLIISSCVICTMTLMLAYGPYSEEIFRGYFEHFTVFLLNLLPVLVLQILLYAISGRQWIAYLITSLIFVAASIGNYYKLTLRNDPFVFADVMTLNTAFGVAGGYTYKIGMRVFIAAISVPLGTLCMGLLARGRIHWIARIALLLACFLGVFPLWNQIYSQKSTYSSEKTDNSEHIFYWSDTQQMVSKGFVYSFIYSITKVHEPVPENYSEKAVEKDLASFTDAVIPDEKKVNIIAIQLEAFADLEQLGISGIDPSAYETYHALKQESYAGELITNIFAGGTVDTERCFLTGSSVLHYYTTQTPSYAWYLRSQGYHTTGSHPCTWEFYNRRSINEYLGFEDYYYTENCYRELSHDLTAYDEYLFPEVLRRYEAMAPEGPVFDFVVTYQGHGPYSTTALKSDTVYWQGEGYSEEAYYALNNYLASVNSTSKELTAMIDALRESEYPVVVLIYGDHKPWLGNDASIYHELGVSFDLTTEQGIKNYYATDYLIWANDSAKKISGFEFTGQAPMTSSGYLMNILFNTLGYEGPAYMQLTEQIRQTLPVITSTWTFSEDGTLTHDLSDKAMEQAQRLWCVQYYRHRHFDEVF